MQFCVGLPMLQQGLTIHSSTAESEIPPVDPGRILKGLTEFSLEQSGSLAARIGVTCRFCYFSYTVDGHEMRYLCRLPSVAFTMSLKVSDLELSGQDSH